MEINSLDNKLSSFFRCLWLKNVLVTNSSHEILEHCSDEGMYLYLLQAFNDLMSIEEPFMHLDPEFIDKISNVVNEYRFKFKESSFDLSNNVITTLNLLKCVPEDRKVYFALNYRSFQEEARGRMFETLQDFLNYNANDFFVFLNILGDDQLSIEKESLFSSCRYFSEVCPEIFIEDELYDNAVGLLEQAKEGVFLKRFSKDYSGACDAEEKIKLIRAKKDN